MESLYRTSVTALPDNVQPISKAPTACTPSSLYQYQKDLDAWTVCQACGRQGFGTRQLENGKTVCDTREQKPGALLACPAGPVNPCYPMAKPLDSLNPWSREQPHSWGSSVFDPKYGTFILWGTWDPAHGRPYFAADAPYMRAGKNTPCP
uniref:Uncharacterized protein n=1 Tax=viral metagenome TaxID=1070528 RepID=A0A6C0BMF1_9ZZZZ